MRHRCDRPLSGESLHTRDTGSVHPIEQMVIALCILCCLSIGDAVADAIPVSVVRLGDVLKPVMQSAPASVVSLNHPRLSAEITGRVEAIHPLVGDRIDQGEVLVELNCSLYESRLAAARAELTRIENETAFARSQLKRARDLKNKRSISEELVERRQTELKAARANGMLQRERVRQREIDVQRCRITAPFDGVVVERIASVGSLASPGTALLELLQSDRLEVTAQLLADELDGLPARAGFRCGLGDYPVSLRTVLPLFDERTRSAEVRFAFTGSTPPVGTAGRLYWQDGQQMLPAEFITRRDGGLGVFIARGQSAHLHSLPEAREGQPAIIDLPTDTRLITDGRQRLQDGNAISVAPSGEP